jgi:(2Fe-2S) ferredoxin
MAVLTGRCKTNGGVDRMGLEGPEPEGQANPCPVCGLIDGCDVRWTNQPFSEQDMEEILEDHDIRGHYIDHNVFPGGKAGSFHPILVVFVDHPLFSRIDFDELMRRRVKSHWEGQQTEAVVLVSMTKFSMQSKLETRTFKQMVDQWRWYDDTFSPGVQLRTKDWSWRKDYSLWANFFTVPRR